MTKAVLFLALAAPIFGQSSQWVEGFDRVEFHHNGNRTRDFRGAVQGYMTAGWWVPAKLRNNVLSWKTAVVPAKQATTFAFIASSSVLPSEFSRGPSARLSVNGHYALTFTIGFTRDMTWKEGEFELKYLSKRVEYPFGGSQRQSDVHGNSGIYHLTVPAALVEVGQPAVIKVELQPFANWHQGWFTVKARRDVLKASMTSLQEEVENLRQDMAMVNQQLQILASQVYSPLVNTRALDHRVIYTNGFRHEHPADLIKLQNGDLLLFAREASEHISDDGDVIMVRSTDGGETWGGGQVVAAIPKLDEREGCGLQLRDGTIVLGIFYNALYDEDGNYTSEIERKKKEDKGISFLGTYFITSKDNGKTWSKPMQLDVTGMPIKGTEGPTDAPIEMPDGSILMALIGYTIDGDMKNNGSVLLRSTDQTKTWTYVSTIASDVGGKMGGLVEPGIVRTKSGRLIVGIRTPQGDNAVHMTHSDDDGKTWSPLKKTAMIGHPTDLIQLSDGRIMASYSLRPGIHTSPGGVRVCFSSDNGETWDIRTEIAIRNDFPNWDVGYPESIELPDGRMLTVYYYNMFNKYYIGGTFWKP